MKNKLSVALATFNEEENIVDLIESCHKIADEIVIVDGNSADRTVELAKKLGVKVISRPNKSMFNINKNIAINNCKNPWIFLIDADERITDSLAKEIKDIIDEETETNGFWVNRKNWFLGGFLTKGGAYPDSVIRLFKKGRGKFRAKDVHEQLEIEGKVGFLKKDLIHIADPNFSRYLYRADRYTDRTADQLEQSEVGKNILSAVNFMVIKPFFTFIKIYIRHKGFKDGFRGFVWALFSAAHFYYAYAKYYTGKQTVLSKKAI